MTSGDSTSSDAAATKGILLFTVSDAFDIPNIGCVLLPGIPHPSGAIPSIQRGAPITLRRPNGTEVQTTIRQFELIRILPPKPFVPISLPLRFTKSDVPTGTEVWFYPANEPNSNSTGNA